MQEKYMVNDALSGVKSELTFYQNTIAECQNPELRNTIIQIRNSWEQSQYELFKLAQQKGYYTPAQMAQPQEVQAVRSQLQ